MDYFDIDSILNEFNSYSSEITDTGEDEEDGLPEAEAPRHAPPAGSPAYTEPAVYHPVRPQYDDGEGEAPPARSQYSSYEYHRAPVNYYDEPEYDEPEYRDREYDEGPTPGYEHSFKEPYDEIPRPRYTDEPARRTGRTAAAERPAAAEALSREKLSALLNRRKTPDVETFDESDYEDEDEDEFPGFQEIRPEKLRIGFLRHVISLVCIPLTVLVLAWLVGSIHPDIGVAETMRSDAKMDLISKISVFANNAKSDALGDLAYIRKIYTIDRSAPCGPKPNPNGYVTYSISEAAQVDELVNRARSSGLLEGQEVIFNSGAQFYHDSDIQCYYDETILVICWKELINERVCSCVEVKVADASQLRRKITEDYFGSSVTQYNTQMAAAVNAVVSSNADFYSFRPYGIMVYQSEIYRYQTTVDTMFVDNNGDFSFLHRFEDPGRDALQQQIYDSNIQFSLAFGPVIVENGEVLHLTDNYGGLGEMNQQYSRAAIGQFDKLHYLLITVNWSDDNTPRATMDQFADIVGTKHLRMAYNLDGGQTSEIVFNGKLFNHVDYGNERAVSDCIYFCTALPESEVSQ